MTLEFKMYTFVIKEKTSTLIGNDNDHFYTTTENIVDEWKPDFGIHDKVYYVYKGLFGKYKLLKTNIQSYWYTNIWGYRLENGHYLDYDAYKDNLFHWNEEIEAMERCIELNKHAKVKIKGEWH